jgi:hypothetical protein
VNRRTGKGISISLWDSEGNSISNETSGYYQEQVWASSRNFSQHHLFKRDMRSWYRPEKQMPSQLGKEEEK